MTRAGQHRRNDAVLGGVALIVTGVVFATGSYRYGLGSLTDMQPGFFPFFLGLVLAALGMAETLAACRAGDREDFGPPAINFRAVACVLGGLLLFGVLIRASGLIPAIFASTVLVMMAERPVRWGRALIYAAAISGLAWGVFIQGLGMPIPLFRG